MASFRIFEWLATAAAVSFIVQALERGKRRREADEQRRRVYEADELVARQYARANQQPATSQKSELVNSIRDRVPAKATTFKQQQATIRLLTRDHDLLVMHGLGQRTRGDSQESLREILQRRLSEEKQPCLGMNYDALQDLVEKISDRLLPCCSLLCFFDLGRSKKYHEVQRAFDAASRHFRCQSGRDDVADLGRFLNHQDQGEPSLLSALSFQRIQENKQARSLTLFYDGLDEHCYGFANAVSGYVYSPAASSQRNDRLAQA